MMLWWRSLVIWFLLMGAEFVHGALRTILLAPVFGDFRARQFSVFSGSLMIIGITWVFIRWIRATSTSLLLSVGVLWLVLTLIFEITLGRFIFGYSWERVASDFNLLGGGLLPVGLLVLTLSPLIAARLRGIR